MSCVSNVKRCIRCGEEFTRRYDHSIPRFAKQEHCSRSCAVKSKEIMPVKHCLNCNAVLIQKLLKDGQTESPAQFKQRKFCNRLCAKFSKSRPRGRGISAIPFSFQQPHRRPLQKSERDARILAALRNKGIV